MYDDLLSNLNSYVKANANNEITGQGLNNILTQFIDTVGAGMRFCGIATVRTSPVVSQYPKFYIAFIPGTYSNFNIQSSFTSGFAIIYDNLGNNTWRMSVKSFDENNGFLVNASVRNNTYGSNTAFYIKNVEKTAQSCSLTIYAFNTDTSTENIVATYTNSQGPLVGYKTHVIEANNIIYSVSVNWDVLSVGEQLEFTIDDTKFPKDAYAESLTDLNLEALNARVKLVEYVGGQYYIDDDKLFRRDLILGRSTYIGATPSFNKLPSTLEEAELDPWLGTNRLIMLLDYNNLQPQYYLDLLCENFPDSNIYDIYLLNDDKDNYTITIRNLDADGITIFSQHDYTLASNSVINIQVLRHTVFKDRLVYKVDSLLY